jgi:flagellar protein FlbD
MILLTRLNGSQVAINADLIERVESNSDTLLSLIDGTRYIVSESPTEVIAKVIVFRARVLATADRLAAELDEGDPEVAAAIDADRSAGRSGLRLVVDTSTSGSGS